MDLISIDQFLTKKSVKFKTEKTKINFFKKLKPASFIKIGETYFISTQEAEILFQKVLEYKIRIKKKRILQAQKNFQKTKRGKLFSANSKKPET